MAELHARRLTAVLTADAQLDAGLHPTALLGGHAHQLAHAALVELLERVVLEKIGLQVVGEELALGVVAREAQGGLGEVVGAEAEEVGVGELVRMAAEKSRGVKPGIKLGICGEHGGEPSSVKFCHRVGLDYVSCSPYRVPIARLAAAQAVLEE